jgi:integrase
MASLHKDPRGKSPFYYVAYRRGDGVRTFKSTRETNLQRAQIVAQMMVRVAEEERRTDTTKDLLQGIVEDTLRRLGIETQPEPTVREYLEQWLANERGSISDASHTKYEMVIRQFLDSLGAPRACLKISQISEADIIKFRDHLRSEGRTPKTVNTTVRNLLKRPFAVAVASGLISKNPVALVRPLKGKAASKDVFTLEQVQALLAVAEGDWYGLILCGFYLGGRISDLAKLQWSNVDLERGLVTFTQSKTGKTIQIPIHGDLHEWLETNRNGITAVFPSLEGRSTGGTTGLSQGFARLLHEAGIEREEIRERSGKKGRVVHGLSFHSLRHTMNSILANSGVSQEQRQAILGHSSKAINSHYTHFTLQTTQSVIAKLPKIA